MSELSIISTKKIIVELQSRDVFVHTSLRASIINDLVQAYKSALNKKDGVAAGEAAIQYFELVHKVAVDD
jgi:hypothetical protein